MEPRLLLSTTFSVTTAADSGAGSLRQAILDANSTPGPDIIDFAIQDPSLRIQPLTALPAITDAVTLDATTQPGYAGSPVVWLDGHLLGDHNASSGLVIQADGSLIKGLSIADFDNYSAIELIGNGNTVQADYLGATPAGQGTLLDNFYGITVAGNNNLVGGDQAGQGNVISNNQLSGMVIQGANTHILNNLIGVDPTGTMAAGNYFDGIEVRGLSDASPASATIQGNVISGNANNGVSFYAEFAGSDVSDNAVGTDRSGSVALGNGTDGLYVGAGAAGAAGVVIRQNIISANMGDGVMLDGAVGAVVAGNDIGTNGAGASIASESGAGLGNQGNGVSLLNGAAGNQIGGSAAADLNVISGSHGDGARIELSAGAGNVVQGNNIGTDLAGTQALSNQGNGVNVYAANNSVLDNLISGNQAGGVLITANSTVVRGNRIGTQADGITALSNQSDGVRVDGSNNLIGGAMTGQGNVIADNVGNGVDIASGTGNAIRGNSIFANNSGDPAYPVIGIDLGDNGVTLNDRAGHTGANLFQNFPVLTSAVRIGGKVTVKGSLAAGASQTYTVDFFSNTAADASGYGQGQTFIGWAVVTTDVNGAGDFTAALDGVPAGQDVITATATDAAGNTSEFSAALTTVPGLASSPSVTMLSSSANPSYWGQLISLSAAVMDPSNAPVTAGLVDFMEGAAMLGSASLDPTGHAAISLSSLSVGDHTLIAIYEGSSDFNASRSSPLVQTVNAAVTATTLASSANPATVGQSITFTATVAATGQAPTGSVSFLDGAMVLGTAALDGTGMATLSTSSLAVGNHTITAAFAGSTNFAASTSAPLAQMVNQLATATTLASSANPSTVGQSITLTATVTAAGQVPTGAVNFLDGAAVLGTATLDATGKATLSTSALAVGNHTITAAFAGSTNFAASTSAPLVQAVNRLATATTLTSSVNPSTVGQSITLTATVTAAGQVPTGSVSFLDGATVLGTATLDGTGKATLSTSAMAVGSHTLTAAFAGSTNFAASTSAPLAQVVNRLATATMLTSSANPSTVGQSITLTATVTAAGQVPTGSVSFLDGTTVLGTVTLDGTGKATLSTSALAVGNHTLTAAFAGSTNFAPSTSAPLTQVVNAAALGQLGGFVYLDCNNDGIKQATESGIAGVTLTLTGTNDLGVITPITVLTGSLGTYTFSSLRPGTYTITETRPAGYIDGKDAAGTLGGTVGNDVVSSIPLTGGASGAGYNFGELKNIIAGQTLRDMSGNGLSSDDVALPGTTVNLYLDRNNNGQLDSYDGSPIATTVSDANGNYAFVNEPTGHYIACEVVPCGYIRTVPYFADYYTVDLTNSAGGTAYTFDNYRLCTWTVTNVSFTINKTRTTTDLRGQTHQGDTVTANFTIAGTQSGYVSLVAYDAPAASFSANTASQQVIDSQVGGMFAPGAHSLTVTLPNNYYQIDFIRCVPIDHFGPAGSNIFFSAEGRLISADNAGLHSDIEDMSAATKFWANLGQTLIGSFNVTDANPAPTALGNWLAQSFPALYGPSSGNDLTGATNAKVASLYLSLYNNSAKSTDVQVLATALNVYSTTLGLGGNAAVSYGFDVSTAGLGASTFNIGSCGQAFNVANNTTLSIWQMLQATNMDSKNGVLYNGVPSLLSMACGMYLQINSDGGVS